ncbi:MAG: RNA-binding domain-containing protein [Candidatus Caldarchaeum sp.]|nr:RNA-binding domain-containing protein [Candidatus Caldarchaeum sp.]
MVYARAVVHPTEDKLKVTQALLNVFPTASITGGEGEVLAKIESLKGLEKMKMIIRSRRIRNTVKTLLSRGIEGNRIVFYLNKQAAAAGKLSFYEKGEVMALGPVEVVVETDDPSGFINWLTE